MGDSNGVLAAAECDAPLHGVFVLGIQSDQLTVSSQQRRAFALARALFESKRLDPGNPAANQVVVIGGGVAGITVAAACAARGTHVTLLERQPQLLHLQRGNSTRWLHPHVYDWPDPHSGDPRTHNPLLNWSQGTAGEVATQLLEEFDHLCRHEGVEIETIVCARDLHVFEGPRVSWNSPRGYAYKVARVVIVATGFGVERGVEDETEVSYWRNDDFDQPRLTIDRPDRTRILVSGTGDGGLVDVLRFRLRAFRHANVVSDFFPLGDPDTQAVIEYLREVRERISHYDIADGHALTREFEEIEHAEHRTAPENVRLKEGLRLIRARVRNRLRDDTIVALAGKEATPLSPKTSILNSFLVWILLAEDLQYFHGEVKRLPKTPGQLDTWVEIIRDGNRALHVYDRVVMRHGAHDETRSTMSTELAKQLQTRHSLGNVHCTGEELKYPFIPPARWHVTTKSATRYLQSLGFHPGSTELRNRRLKIFDDSGAEVAEHREDQTLPDSEVRGDDPLRYRTIPSPWRAGVLRSVLAHLEQLIPADHSDKLTTAVLFTGPSGKDSFGLGKTLLWQRFVADDDYYRGQTQTDRGRSSPNPRSLVIDYSAAASGGTHRRRGSSLRELETCLAELVTRFGDCEQPLHIILDGCSQGLRAEFRRRGDSVDPNVVIHEHLEAIAGALKWLRNRGVLTVLTIVSDSDPEGTDQEPFTRRIIDQVERIEQGSDRLMRLSRHRVQLLDHPAQKRGQDRIGAMLRSDATRVVDAVLSAPSSHTNGATDRHVYAPREQRGRYMIANPRTAIDRRSLFELLRPLSKRYDEVVGFRANSMFAAVATFDRLLDLLERCGETLDLVRRIPAENSGEEASRWRAHHTQAWREFLEQRALGLEWLHLEITEGEYLVAKDALIRPEASASRVRTPESLILRRLVSAFMVLCLPSTPPVNQPWSKGPPPTWILGPRPEVGPIAYSNLCSALCVPMWSSDPQHESGFSIELNGFDLVRPTFEAKRRRWLRLGSHFTTKPETSWLSEDETTSG